MRSRSVAFVGSLNVVAHVESIIANQGHAVGDNHIAAYVRNCEKQSAVVNKIRTSRKLIFQIRSVIVSTLPTAISVTLSGMFMLLSAEFANAPLEIVVTVSGRITCQPLSL